MSTPSLLENPSIYVPLFILPVEESFYTSLPTQDKLIVQVFYKNALHFVTLNTSDTRAAIKQNNDQLRNWAIKKGYYKNFLHPTCYVIDRFVQHKVNGYKMIPKLQDRFTAILQLLGL